MSTPQLLIATHNKGKFIEIKEIMGDDLPFEFCNLDDLNIKDEADENGQTFAENARIKAEFFGKIANLPTLADDSGIIVSALKNELGLHTRRWGAGEKATDAEWIEYFLKRMQQTEDKKAQFICTSALYINNQTFTFEGITEGIITEKLEADYLPGLPLSATFKPIGYDQVFSALSVEEKNKISHRGKAFLKLKDFLKKQN